MKDESLGQLRIDLAQLSLDGRWKNTFSIVGGFEPVIFPRLFCFLVPYQQGEQNYPAVEFGTDGFHIYNCFTIFIGTILVRKWISSI